MRRFEGVDDLSSQRLYVSDAGGSYLIGTGALDNIKSAQDVSMTFMNIIIAGRCATESASASKSLYGRHPMRGMEATS